MQYGQHITRPTAPAFRENRKILEHMQQIGPIDKIGDEMWKFFQICHVAAAEKSTSRIPEHVREDMQTTLDYLVRKISEIKKRPHLFEFEDKDDPDFIHWKRKIQRLLPEVEKIMRYFDLFPMFKHVMSEYFKIPENGLINEYRAESIEAHDAHSVNRPSSHPSYRDDEVDSVRINDPASVPPKDQTMPSFQMSHRRVRQLKPAADQLMDADEEDGDTLENYGTPNTAMR